jgi:signal transduction histidine kinase
MEFRYTASTFIAPERLRFKFKLEGHDSDWRDGGTRRAAMYTALAPGPYRFRVLTVSPQGTESETRAEFAFSLAPYFHQTPWFYAALAMAVLLSGWGVHRLRVRLLMRRKALEQQLALALERERIAKDMHDDLGASLTQIGLLSEHARRLPTDSPELACDLEKIAQTTRQTTVATEEMVWVVSPRHDTLDSLVTHLCQLAGEYLRPSGIRCRLEVPTQVPELRVSSDVRHNLVLFLKEALNNVVKHSSAQEVWLALNVADSTLTLALTDDGRGCRISQPATPNPQRASNGNGLLNLRKRAESVGGKFELLSRPGRGTFGKVSLNLAP